MRDCDWVVEMELALNLDELSAAARQVREKRVPYRLSAGCLW